MTEPFLSVDRVSLSIKGEPILDDVSFSADRGEVVGIVGRNGSGKSMLFKSIAGLFIPQHGEISVGGFGVVSSRRFPPGLGALIERPGFVGSMSAYDNLALLASIQRKIGRVEITESLEMVGLAESARTHVRKFSLGMKQRLGIAQSIMEGPSLLVLDEPTGGLDAAGTSMLRDIVCGLRDGGVAILIASHLQEDIGLLCDRVFCMERGRLHRHPAPSQPGAS
jgi:ABC-2 type transport system ATP-binding protein